MSEYKNCLNDILTNTKKYNLYFAGLLLCNLAVKLSISDYQFKRDLNYIKNKVKSESNAYNTSILDIEDAIEAYNNKTVLVYDNTILKRLMEDF